MHTTATTWTAVETCDAHKSEKLNHPHMVSGNDSYSKGQKCMATYIYG